MTAERNARCEDRIDGELRDRMETFSALVKASRTTDVDELTDAELVTVTNLTEPDRSEYEGQRGAERLADEAQTTIYEMPLSVETIRTVKVLLSTGGPADWFEAQLDDDGDIRRIEYVYQDWFDGARRTLDGADFDTAADFIRNFIDA